MWLLLLLLLLLGSQHETSDHPKRRSRHVDLFNAPPRREDRRTAAVLDNKNTTAEKTANATLQSGLQRPFPSAAMVNVTGSHSFNASRGRFAFDRTGRSSSKRRKQQRMKAKKMAVKHGRSVLSSMDLSNALHELEGHTVAGKDMSTAVALHSCPTFSGDSASAGPPYPDNTLSTYLFNSRGGRSNWLNLLARVRSLPRPLLLFHALRAWGSPYVHQSVDKVELYNLLRAFLPDCESQVDVLEGLLLAGAKEENCPWKDSASVEGLHLHDLSYETYMGCWEATKESQCFCSMRRVEEALNRFPEAEFLYNCIVLQPRWSTVLSIASLQEEICTTLDLIRTGKLGAEAHKAATFLQLEYINNRTSAVLKSQQISELRTIEAQGSLEGRMMCVRVSMSQDIFEYPDASERALLRLEQQIKIPNMIKKEQFFSFFLKLMPYRRITYPSNHCSFIEHASAEDSSLSIHRSAKRPPKRRVLKPRESQRSPHSGLRHLPPEEQARMVVWRLSQREYIYDAWVYLVSGSVEIGPLFDEDEDYFTFGNDPCKKIKPMECKDDAMIKACGGNGLEIGRPWGKCRLLDAETKEYRCRCKEDEGFEERSNKDGKSECVAPCEGMGHRLCGAHIDPSPGTCNEETEEEDIAHLGHYTCKCDPKRAVDGWDDLSNTPTCDKKKECGRNEDRVEGEKYGACRGPALVDHYYRGQCWRLDRFAPGEYDCDCYEDKHYRVLYKKSDEAKNATNPGEMKQKAFCAADCEALGNAMCGVHETPPHGCTDDDKTLEQSAVHAYRCPDCDTTEIYEATRTEFCPRECSDEESHRWCGGPQEAELSWGTCIADPLIHGKYECRPSDGFVAVEADALKLKRGYEELFEEGLEQSAVVGRSYEYKSKAEHAAGATSEEEKEHKGVTPGYVGNMTIPSAKEGPSFKQFSQARCPKLGDSLCQGQKPPATVSDEDALGWCEPLHTRDFTSPVGYKCHCDPKKARPRLNTEYHLPTCAGKFACGADESRVCEGPAPSEWMDNTGAAHAGKCLISRPGNMSAIVSSINTISPYRRIKQQSQDRNRETQLSDTAEPPAKPLDSTCQGAGCTCEKLGSFLCSGKDEFIELEGDAYEQKMQQYRNEIEHGTCIEHGVKDGEYKGDYSCGCKEEKADLAVHPKTMTQMCLAKDFDGCDDTKNDRACIGPPGVTEQYERGKCYVLKTFRPGEYKCYAWPGKALNNARYPVELTSGEHNKKEICVANCAALGSIMCRGPTLDKPRGTCHQSKQELHKPPLRAYTCTCSHRYALEEPQMHPSAKTQYCRGAAESCDADGIKMCRGERNDAFHRGECLLAENELNDVLREIHGRDFDNFDKTNFDYLLMDPQPYDCACKAEFGFVPHPESTKQKCIGKCSYLGYHLCAGEELHRSGGKMVPFRADKPDKETTIDKYGACIDDESTEGGDYRCKCVDRYTIPAENRYTRTQSCRRKRMGCVGLGDIPLRACHGPSDSPAFRRGECWQSSESEPYSCNCYEESFNKLILTPPADQIVCAGFCLNPTLRASCQGPHSPLLEVEETPESKSDLMLFGECIESPSVNDVKEAQKQCECKDGFKAITATIEGKERQICAATCDDNGQGIGKKLCAGGTTDRMPKNPIEKRSCEETPDGRRWCAGPSLKQAENKYKKYVRGLCWRHENFQSEQYECTCQHPYKRLLFDGDKIVVGDKSLTNINNGLNSRSAQVRADCEALGKDMCGGKEGRKGTCIKGDISTDAGAIRESPSQSYDCKCDTEYALPTPETHPITQTPFCRGAGKSCPEALERPCSGEKADYSKYPRAKRGKCVLDEWDLDLSRCECNADLGYFPSTSNKKCLGEQPPSVRKKFREKQLFVAGKCKGLGDYLCAGLDIITARDPHAVMNKLPGGRSKPEMHIGTYQDEDDDDYQRTCKKDIPDHLGVVMGTQQTIKTQMCQCVEGFQLGIDKTTRAQKCFVTCDPYGKRLCGGSKQHNKDRTPGKAELGTCSHGPDGDYQCTCHDKIAFRDFYTGFKGRKLHMCQARCSEEYQRNCEGPFKKWGTCDQMDNENDAYTCTCVGEKFNDKIVRGTNAKKKSVCHATCASLGKELCQEDEDGGLGTCHDDTLDKDGHYRCTCNDNIESGTDPFYGTPLCKKPQDCESDGKRWCAGPSLQQDREEYKTYVRGNCFRFEGSKEAYKCTCNDSYKQLKFVKDRKTQDGYYQKEGLPFCAADCEALGKDMCGGKEGRKGTCIKGDNSTDAGAIRESPSQSYDCKCATEYALPTPETHPITQTPFCRGAGKSCPEALERPCSGEKADYSKYPRAKRGKCVLDEWDLDLSRCECNADLGYFPSTSNKKCLSEQPPSVRKKVREKQLFVAGRCKGLGDYLCAELDIIGAENPNAVMNKLPGDPQKRIGFCEPREDDDYLCTCIAHTKPEYSAVTTGHGVIGYMQMCQCVEGFQLGIDKTGDQKCFVTCDPYGKRLCGGSKQHNKDRTPGKAELGQRR
ncbi:unnamed protein product [Vitrella brassicaformis CCMP3155]|uniref:EGF-like domain-containing protein n=1 Tax=Vitrella brassicaformis (strain CCMP3155) TaxID=1169540 RepID=A0A0G4F9Q1_VITBC|nr:unnamed protein product [Vitrella brassicaformis CCMP3155]|eukprot:CEM09686.1 unnamed protein product [Vitrella brassicaformis CCMP3155]